MKKLMIAAAVVCATVFVQAATVNWTSNGMSLCDKDGNKLGGQPDVGTIVLVNLGSSMDWDKATVIPEGSGSGKTTMTISTSTGNKRGRMNGAATFTYTGAASDLIHNGDYLALMYQDEDGNLSKLKYVADGSDVTATALVSGFALDTDSKDGVITLSGNFYAASVPEPTSALLMLLGVAGLALRRRRA